MFLKALGTAIIPVSGCLSMMSGQSNSNLTTIDNPPKWLKKEADCEYPKGSIELSEQENSGGETYAEVDFSKLSKDVKMIVTFAVHHGKAETCTDSGGTVFQVLMGELMKYGTDPYRDKYNSRPLGIILHVRDSYYNVDEMMAFDQTLV